MALIALLTTLAAAAAQAAVPAAPPPDDPWSSPDIVAPRMDARPLARPRGAAYGGERSSDRPPASSTVMPAGSSLRTTLALGGVLGLIVLLAWGYRVAAGRGTGLRWTLRGRHPGLIEVVSRAALSPRQSLCLVRVGPRLVLLGVTPEAVRALDVIQDGSLVASLLGQAAGQRPDSHTAEFARCLAALEDTPTETMTDGNPDRQAAASETGPDEDRLVRTRHALAGALAKVRGVGQRCETLGPRRAVVGARK